MAMLLKLSTSGIQKNVVYDAVFDSRTMNKQVFEEQMKMKLAELNSEGDESVYKIGYDDPVPYQSASPSELAQASTAYIYS